MLVLVCCAGHACGNADVACKGIGSPSRDPSLAVAVVQSERPWEAEGCGAGLMIGEGFPESVVYAEIRRKKRD